MTLYNSYRLDTPRNILTEARGGDYHQWLNSETEDWLVSEVGWGNWERCVNDKITFYFRHEEDRFKFILRWL